MDQDLLIVGGGLNGPALALAAAQAGFTVTIIDALPLDTRKDPAFDGRAYALALASVRLLRGIGVWSAIDAQAQPMREIKVTDGRAGEGPSPWMMHFDHAEIEEGPMGYMIEAGRVLIGCDGRRSGTADRAGITRTAWGYDQTAIVCAVKHEKPNSGIAHQFFMPNGPLAILPLTGDRSSIVWSEQSARAAEIIALDDTGFLEALKPAFGSFLGEISLAGDRFAYPLGLSLVAPF